MLHKMFYYMSVFSHLTASMYNNLARIVFLLEQTMILHFHSHSSTINSHEHRNAYISHSDIYIASHQHYFYLLFRAIIGLIFVAIPPTHEIIQMQKVFFTENVIRNY